MQQFWCDMAQKRKREVTITDLAAVCGFSYQTVSRAINGMEDIPKAPVRAS
jgi:hypothetical protein